MKSGTVDRIMAVSAVITATVAVLLAVYELHLTREYQRLSVEPYLEMGNYRDNGYEFVIVNNGLGPAEIQSVEVTVEGKKVTTWGEVENKFFGSNTVASAYSGLAIGRRVKVAERVNAYHLDQSEMADLFHQNVFKLNVSICYCSIYQECWVGDFQEVTHKSVPECIKMERGFPHS